MGRRPMAQVGYTQRKTYSWRRGNDFQNLNLDHHFCLLFLCSQIDVFLSAVMLFVLTFVSMAQPEWLCGCTAESFGRKTTKAIRNKENGVEECSKCHYWHIPEHKRTFASSITTCNMCFKSKISATETEKLAHLIALYPDGKRWSLNMEYYSILQNGTMFFLIIVLYNL